MDREAPGADGPRYIAEKIGAFTLAGEAGGVELWRGVAERFDQLDEGVEMPRRAS